MELTPPMISEPEKEKEIVPSVIDPMLLSLVHQSIIQQHATSVNLLVMTVKTESALPVQMASKHGED